MTELRFNPLAGRWVTVAGERMSRPSDFVPRRLPVEAEPNRPCPFCPGHEEDTPPALESYGPKGGWQVRVVPNLYPAFAGAGSLVPTDHGPLHRSAPARGIHEVLVLSPHHRLSWADLSDAQAGLVMAAIYRATLDEIVRDNYRVLDQRISLPPLRKLWLAGKTWYMA